MSLSKGAYCSVVGCGAEAKIRINWHRDDYPRQYCPGHARDLASEYLDYLDEDSERLQEELDDDQEDSS